MDTEDLPKLAKQVVEVIRPKPGEHLRQEVLQRLFVTKHMALELWQDGTDYQLRNGIVSLSKALRKIFNEEQPVRRLVIPKKGYFGHGSMKGEFSGTIYQLTPLGEQVKILLLAEGIINTK